MGHFTMDNLAQRHIRMVRQVCIVSHFSKEGQLCMVGHFTTVPLKHVRSLLHGKSLLHGVTLARGSLLTASF